MFKGKLRDLEKAKNIFCLTQSKVKKKKKRDLPSGWSWDTVDFPTETALKYYKKVTV